MGTGWRVTKGKNWDNCNSIVIKIYLKGKKWGKKVYEERRHDDLL